MAPQRHRAQSAVKNSGVHCRDAGKMKVTTFCDIVLNTNPVDDIPKGSGLSGRAAVTDLPFLQ